MLHAMDVIWVCQICFVTAGDVGVSKMRPPVPKDQGSRSGDMYGETSDVRNSPCELAAILWILTTAIGSYQEEPIQTILVSGGSYKYTVHEPQVVYSHPN